LADIWSWRELYSDCECVIAGDFNTVMGSNDAVALRLNDFVNSCSLGNAEIAGLDNDGRMCGQLTELKL